MGRNRKKSHQQLPKRVYVNRGRYVFIDRIDGVQQKAIVIGKSDMHLPDVWDAWRVLTGKSNESLQFIVDKYTESDAFKAKPTHKETLKALNRLLSHQIGANKTLGQAKYNDITPGIIRQYLDLKNNVSGNRQITYLSSAWSWCYERDIVRVPNPCRGVKKIAEHARTRYVTDSEYAMVYALANDYVKTSMELAYLCRMRLSEVLDARVKDIEPEGLNVRRLKGSVSTLTLWNDRLKSAIDTSLDGCLRVPEMPIVNNGKGEAIKLSAFKSAWQRLMNKADCERFTFHDLKAKGVSDFEGDKKLASGHKTAAMVEIYDRKRKKVEATE